MRAERRPQDRGLDLDLDLKRARSPFGADKGLRRSEHASERLVKQILFSSILALGLLGLGPTFRTGLHLDGLDRSRAGVNPTGVGVAPVDGALGSARMSNIVPASSEMPALDHPTDADGLPHSDGLPHFEHLEIARANASERLFGLPFGEPPGPGSWYVSQPYGNTVYAFYERMGLYKSGQGLHMGLDLAAPCGTPVLAVGDGVVLSVDGRGGAPPHNLMIDHSNGFVSFYGHLLERPNLTIGQYVRRGQPVARSGDMYSSCVASPHLHLEIRDPSLNKVFNPVSLIDADWHGILLLGAAPLAFERDMEAPRRWQTIEDQPPIQLGGPLLNDFESPWPGDGR